MITFYRVLHYEHNLDLPDYREMAGILGKVKARFILSINDHPEIRKVFEHFKIRPVKLKYSVRKDTCTEGKELLVSNF